MKFSENSLVVDVIKISNSSYKLSVPAGDMLTAAMNGAVLRRHDLSTAAVPNVLYVPLSEAKLSSGTYSFKFASGDVFTASSADAYPAASSVSDKTDSELPAVATTDKGKFLHTNESTGDLEWATAGGSGGGVEIVRFEKTKAADSNTEGRCDHTLDELIQAYAAGKDILCYISDYNGFITPLGILMVSDDPQSTYAMTPFFMYSDETKNYRISVFMNADGVSVTRVEVQ